MSLGRFREPASSISTGAQRPAIVVPGRPDAPGGKCHGPKREPRDVICLTTPLIGNSLCSNHDLNHLECTSSPTDLLRPNVDARRILESGPFKRWRLSVRRHTCREVGDITLSNGALAGQTTLPPGSSRGKLFC